MKRGERELHVTPKVVRSSRAAKIWPVSPSGSWVLFTHAVHDWPKFVLHVCLLSPVWQAASWTP